MRLTGKSKNGYQLNYTYDGDDSVETVTDGGGYQLHLYYTQVGTAPKIYQARLNGQVLFNRTFDEYGRIVQTLNRDNVVVTNDYDFLDRVVARRTIGDSGYGPEMTGLESFTYNTNGLGSYTDVIGKVSRYLRDSAGRVLYETNANNQVLAFAYNPTGELLTLTDGKGQTTGWNYDGYAFRRHVATYAVVPNHGDEKTVLRSVVYKDYQPSATNMLPPLLKIKPDAVMATVNGRALTAVDVLPPGSFDQPVSLDVSRYFLQRAIDRELIHQTAKARDVALNKSQEQQMVDFKTTREQHGPGFVRDLNGGAEELSFEMRDAEAFMLQTSLMEKLGVSPNVTAQQVSDYYQRHKSDFDGLPVEESARQEAWGKIDFQIRQLLAFNVRTDFQNKLADYMKRIQTEANIQVTPLTSFASSPQ